jgi:hypothetical protein
MGLIIRPSGLLCCRLTQASAETGGSMVAELHSIHIHLWVLTGLLAIILFAAGYCNYSRVKQQVSVRPHEHMTDLWERAQFSELRDYTSGYLKTRPNAPDVLLYHAMVSWHFKDRQEALRVSEILANSSPGLRKSALSMIEAINAEATS